MKRLFLALLAFMASPALAQRQPANVSTQPTTVPQEFDLLDKGGVWVPFGTVDPTTHTFSPNPPFPFVQPPDAISVTSPPYNAVCSGDPSDMAADVAGVQAALATGKNVVFPSGKTCFVANAQIGQDQKVFAYGATLNAATVDNGSGSTVGSDTMFNLVGPRAEIHGGLFFDSNGYNVAQSNLIVAIPVMVNAAYVNAVGSGGTPGACTLTGTTGTGTKFQASVTVGANGTITKGSTLPTVTNAGSYSVMPGWTSGPYQPDQIAEPVTGCGLTGATMTLQMGSGTTLTIASSNATPTTPAFQVGQRIMIRADTGHTYQSFITGVTGNVVTIQDQIYAPAAIGATVWASRGSIWLGGSSCNECVIDGMTMSTWAGILLDSVTGTQFSPMVRNVVVTSAHLFGLVVGRTPFGGLLSNIYITGGFDQVDTFSGDGSTTTFTLGQRQFKTGPTSATVTVGGTAWTYGAGSNGFTWAADGLHVVLTSAPANLTPIVVSYGAHTSWGITLSHSTGGQLFTNTFVAATDSDYVSQSAAEFTMNGPGADACNYAGLLFDGVSAGNYFMSSFEIGNCPYGIRAINGAKGLRTNYGFFPTAGSNMPNGVTSVDILSDLGTNVNRTYHSGGYASLTTEGGLPLSFTANFPGQPQQAGQGCIGCPSWAGMINGLFQFHGTGGDIVVGTAGNLVLSNFTSTTIPTCNNPNKYSVAGVSDGVASPTLGATYSGGGSTVWPVFCNGTNWTYH